MAGYEDIEITEEFLDKNPNAVFVFGDNLERRGYGGAARLRDHTRAIGFITKKSPNNRDESFYKPEEYSPVFFEELEKLKRTIQKDPDKTFYVSQLGGGLANKYNIWNNTIKINLIKHLEYLENVVFLW